MPNHLGKYVSLLNNGQEQIRGISDICAVIIVNYNSTDDLVECLESLMHLEGDNWKVIVVDNASPEGLSALDEWASGISRPTSPMLRSGLQYLVRRTPNLHYLDDGESINDYGGAADITIVRSAENLGFAGANNLGLSLARAMSSIKHFWLLNPDTALDSKAGLALLAQFSQDSRLGMAGSTLIYYYQPNKVQGVGVHYNIWTTIGRQIFNGIAIDQLPNEIPDRRFTYPIGASLMISRDFLETVGPMEEGFFLYFEELDWVLRNNSRFRSAWCPQSIVFHKEGGAIGTSTVGLPSVRSVYYFSRALLLFYRKHRPWLLPVAIARLCFNALRFAIGGCWAHAGAVWMGGKNGLMSFSAGR